MDTKRIYTEIEESNILERRTLRTKLLNSFLNKRQLDSNDRSGQKSNKRSNKKQSKQRKGRTLDCNLETIWSNNQRENLQV